MTRSSGGVIYIADTDNNVIRRIAVSGMIDTFAGTGIQGFSGDGGKASLAQLDHPASVAIGPDDSLYIADTRNQRVRHVSLDGSITTIAGSELAGFSGDGGPASKASLRLPVAIWVSNYGIIYIADTGNQRVRRVSVTGIIDTMAGNGEQGSFGDGGPALSAALDSPSGLALDGTGQLLVADRGNNRIRIINTSGTISTLDLKGAQPLLRPNGVAATPEGDLLVAESGAHQVRQFHAGSSSVLIGNGVEAPFTTGADPRDTSLSSPALAMPNGNGDISIVDRGNHQLQRIAIPLLDFGSIPAGAASGSQSLVLENGGTSSLTVSAICVPSGFKRLAASTCAEVSFHLQAAERCSLALAFVPTAQGSQAGLVSVEVADSGPQQLRLLGIATAPGTQASAPITLTSTGSIAYAGTAIQVVAHVAASTAAPPTGLVHFRDSSTDLGQSVVAADGTASFSTSGLAVGSHSLNAVYSGDQHYGPSTSPALQMLVALPPDFSIALSGAQIQSATAGSPYTVGFSLQPQNGALGKPVQLTVSGMPSGWSSTFSPANPVLGSDPVAVAVSILPASTISDLGWPAMIATAGLLLFVRRRRVAYAGLLSASLLFCAGCGSGYLGTGTGGKAAHSYPITITASAIGVTGATLVHSASLTLVVH